MDTVDFIKQFPLRFYEKGEAIMGEGEVVSTFLFIESGFIKITSLDETGVEHLLWIACSEDSIPSEHFFSLHNHLAYFYTALTSTSVRCVPKSDYLTHARSNPPVMADIAASLSDYHDDLLMRVGSLSQPSIHDKLVATLRYLGSRFGNGTTVDLHKIGLTLTHQDIAEMIGSTRETTSLELEKLRLLGYISYSRSCFVINTNELQSVHP